MRKILSATASVALVAAGFTLPAPASAQQASGSFQGSCRNVQTGSGVLTAECADAGGRYHVSSIPFAQCKGDIGNNNGILTCNGATATGGALVADSNAAPPRPNNDQNRGQRSNSGSNALAAGAVGAIVGAFAGNALANRNNQQPQPQRLYAPGYAYPSYGDQRYGDPQYDPRYAQGGYAEGRPARQWVPVADRASWLDQRIDRGIQERTLDQNDVRSLRGELRDLESLERDYQRRGLQGWMRTDLDKRFDQLAARIQYERTDGDSARANQYDRSGDRGYVRGAPDYGQSGQRSDPELAGIEQHILRQIREGVRDDLIARDDAGDLERQLRGIQAREQAQLRRSGYRLSDYSRRSFRQELTQLDRQVDDIRNQP